MNFGFVFSSDLEIAYYTLRLCHLKLAIKKSKMPFFQSWAHCGMGERRGLKKGKKKKSENLKGKKKGNRSNGQVVKCGVWSFSL